jgi:hypothetical protein
MIVKFTVPISAENYFLFGRENFLKAYLKCVDNPVAFW